MWKKERKRKEIMPAKLDRCVKQVAKKMGKKAAWPICVASVKGKKGKKK